MEIGRSNRQRMNFLIDADIRKLLKESQIFTNDSMSDIVNNLLRQPLIEYLEKLRQGS